MTLTELQTQVGAWHRAEFGPLGDATALRRKLREEADEFLSRSIADVDGGLEEAADIVIVLLAWVDRHGRDLEAAVRRKFAVVAARDQLGRDVAKGVVRLGQPVR